jgi:hypothetical protein
MGMSSLPTSVCFISETAPLAKLLQYQEKDRIWMVTNNILFKKDFFKKFINDSLLLDVFSMLDNRVGVGHDLERYTTLYCILNNINYGIIQPVCLEHVAMDSHATQGRFHNYEKFIQSFQ